MSASGIDVPPAWENLTFSSSSTSGLILVIGAPDTGKTTFARYLYRRLHEHHERVAFLDGDMGQATLGPPTTMTLALGRPGDDGFPPTGSRFRSFVGDVSPRRHMLPTLVGAERLVGKAREEGATAIVYDTTGLIDPAQGGGALKRAKIDLLHPTLVFGLQRGSELEHLLMPLRRSRRTRVIDLQTPAAAHRREVAVRQSHRANRFRRYFEDARDMELSWGKLAVFPKPHFAHHQLAVLEDREGFALALGIVLSSDVKRSSVTLRTPLKTPNDDVDAMRLGDLTLDPRTYRESRLR